jgi:hypothetical protein
MEVEIVKVRDEAGDHLNWKGNANHTFYNADFESRFFEDTRNSYSFKASGWESSLSCPEYLLEAKRVLEEEEDRADKMLDMKSKQPLLDIVENEVVEKHA